MIIWLNGKPRGKWAASFANTATEARVAVAVGSWQPASLESFRLR